MSTTRLVQRIDLAPGQMFVYGRRLLVVLNRDHEVDFWTGTPMRIGAMYGWRQTVEAL